MTKGMARKSREESLRPQTSPFSRKISDDSKCEMSSSEKDQREREREREREQILEVQG